MLQPPFRSRLAGTLLLCSSISIRTDASTSPPVPSLPIGEVAIRIPAPLGLPNSTRFGIAVAMADDRLFIGCDGRRDGPPLEGKVLVFESDPSGSWDWSTTLIPPQSQPGDEFGRSLALHGTHLVIGAPGTDGHRGAAWCVDLSASEDPLPTMHRIPIPDASPGDRFGESIAIHRGLVAVGAPRADVDGLLDRGRVVTASITRNGAEPWGEPTPNRPQSGLRFGWSLAIGTMVAVGAPGADVPSERPGHPIDRAGAVIRFDVDPSHRRIDRRRRPVARRLERFGTCLSNTGSDAIIVGSPRGLLGDVRSGVISLVSGPRTDEIGARLQPESALGEPLVGNHSTFAAGMPGRRDENGRAAPSVRLGRILPGSIAPILDLVLEDPERTLLSLSLSPAGRMLAIGSPDPAFDDGPEIPGEVHVVRLEPMLRTAR